MKKQDLKTGMTVIFRDGSIGKVLLNTPKWDVIVILDQSGNSWSELENWDDDLKIGVEELACLDIMKIYCPTHRSKYLETDLKYHKLLWERKEEEYYLKDNFLTQDSSNYGYLNFGIVDNIFWLSDVYEENDSKTKFTDKEIEELEIPIERFEKIEVEE